MNRQAMIGTRVEVTMRMPSGVSVFMAFWLSFAAAVLVVAVVVALRDPSRSWFVLIALAFLGFGYGLMIFSFSFEARRMRETLEPLLVSCVAAAQLPAPVSHGWAIFGSVTRSFPSGASTASFSRCTPSQGR